MDKAGNGKGMTKSLAEMTSNENYTKLMDIIEVARAHLDNMKDGEKTNTAELTKHVAEQMGMTISHVTPMVSIALKSYDGITISRGRYGGIIKGVKAKKAEERERCVTCHQPIRKKRVTGEAVVNAATSNDSPDADEEDEFDDDSEEGIEAED